ncbi:MAG: hypothetical protein ACE5RF_03460 [Nitrosarchaeum sp.]
MIRSDLIPGEEIYIEGDLFTIISKTDRRKTTGCYEYILESPQEDILSGVIHYFNAGKIILEIVRTVDCQIKGRAIQYKGELYQISKQYDEVKYDKESDSMIRNNIYEITRLKEGMIGGLGPKKIIIDKNKNKIFYDFREITMNEFSKDKEIKEEKGRPKTISFTYTFKEPVG